MALSSVALGNIALTVQNEDEDRFWEYWDLSYWTRRWIRAVPFQLPSRATKWIDMDSFLSRLSASIRMKWSDDSWKASRKRDNIFKTQTSCQRDPLYYWVIVFGYCWFALFWPGCFLVLILGEFLWRLIVYICNVQLILSTFERYFESSSQRFCWWPSFIHSWWRVSCVVWLFWIASRLFWIDCNVIEPNIYSLLFSLCILIDGSLE